MKKLFRLVFAVALVSLLSTTAFAADTYNLSLSSQDTSLTVGDTFSVFVKLSNNSGFGALESQLSYDSDVLTCTRVKSGALLTENGAMFAGNHRDNSPKFAAISAYPIEGNGIVAELVFRAEKSGFTTINFASVLMSSTDGNSCRTSVTPLEITVNASLDGTVPEEKPLTPPEKDPTEDPEIGTPDVVFTDVPKTHWAYTYIQNAVQNKLFSGIGNGQFGPTLNVTRGMFVTTLYSSAGSPDVELSNFTDVPANAWYAKAVAWANQEGIVSGIGNNKFGPDLPITREQIALILYNYAGGVSPGTEAFVRMSYPDGKDIHDWALTAFTWAMNQELISGKSGNILDPLATATRAEVAVIMQNFVTLRK